MLDKSLPYLNILMKRSADAPDIDLQSYSLPQGYVLRPFAPADQAGWAEILESVLEFGSREEALAFFASDFLPYIEDVEKRFAMVFAPNGEAAGTCGFWTGPDTKTPFERPWLQWVAVRPAHQGKGIGAAMVARTIENALRQCGEGEVYLHTQTWSHAAVRLYKRLGFRIMTEPTVAHYDNSRVREALALLEEIGKRRREDSEAKPSF